MGMCVVKVTNSVLQSELLLHAWRYGTGFTVRHSLPDDRSLCRATFTPTTLVHALCPLRFEIHHCQAEANIKNWLLLNCSLSKIRWSHLEKLAIS